MVDKLDPDASHCVLEGDASHCVIEADVSHFVLELDASHGMISSDASLVFTKMFLFNVISNLILYELYFTTY